MNLRTTGGSCSCGGWVDWKHDKKKIGFGTGVFDPYWADFHRRLREAADKIRKAVPECKVLVYYDTQRDTSDGGRERFRFYRDRGYPLDNHELKG